MSPNKHLLWEPQLAEAWWLAQMPRYPSPIDRWHDAVATRGLWWVDGPMGGSRAVWFHVSWRPHSFELLMVWAMCHMMAPMERGTRSGLARGCSSTSSHATACPCSDAMTDRTVSEWHSCTSLACKTTKVLCMHNTMAAASRVERHIVEHDGDGRHHAVCDSPGRAHRPPRQPPPGFASATPFKCRPTFFFPPPQPGFLGKPLNL